ncbi:MULTISPECIES: LysE family translocator [unclassified Burkholderia]|uniref:LysE family translocator n=1 Tax=unclassified Burkholderia TaxID=2613784 RepID=UPI00075CFCEB|nr:MULTISPECIES: LysE family translocator [unclassified Burkholderia]KVN14301.1 amino acid transporter [Burkholderia sp. MSMB1552]KWZ56924.1 amino acid transporter [Burkholderia sp. MSMB1588]
MVNWAAVLTVLSVYAAGVIVPGPNFVAVAHKAAASTRTDAFALVGGIVLVNLFWASCAILGVGAVFAAFPWVAFAVKLAGAGYLIWFGSRLVLSAGRSASAALANGTSGGGLCQAFTQGFATNISNPKSMAFYAAIFSAAAPTHVSAPTFAAMLTVVAVVATAWYGFVALALAHPAIAASYRKRKAVLDRVCGGAIIALGIRQMIR